MAAPIGVPIYPGILQPERCEATLSHGITPSVFTIEFAAQAGVPSIDGDLILTYGDAIVAFYGCRLDRATLRYNADGQVVACSIFDRRWKWNAGGMISGHYNLRWDDGTLDPAREQPPQNLMAACLLAMQEQGFDVSSVPNFTRPEIHWDHDNPAQALAQLAEQLGCRIVLRLDNTVWVGPTGLGFDLGVDGTTEAASVALNPAKIPDGFLVACGPSRFQNDFLLEAVGLDVDGSIKPIEQLSYRPLGGWAFIDPEYFEELADAAQADLGVTSLAQACALQSIYRWYRIKLTMLDGVTPLTIPSCPFPILDIKQLELEDEQANVFLDLDGQLKAMPAWLFGVFDTADLDFTDQPFGTRYQYEFSVDKKHQLVMTGEQVYRQNAAAGFSPANLVLRCACRVREYATFAEHRYERVLSTGTNYGTGVRVLKHDDLWYASIPVYTQTPPNFQLGPGVAPPQPTIAGVVNNQPGLDQACDYYIEAALLEYQTPAAQEVTYAGLKWISPDGAIQQVTFRLGPEGTTTTACRNSEFSPVVPSYKERRLMETLRHGRLPELAAKVTEIAKATAIANRKQLL